MPICFCFFLFFCFFSVCKIHWKFYCSTIAYHFGLNAIPGGYSLLANPRQMNNKGAVAGFLPTTESNLRTTLGVEMCKLSIIGRICKPLPEKLFSDLSGRYVVNIGRFTVDIWKIRGKYIIDSRLIFL